MDFFCCCFKRLNKKEEKEKEKEENESTDFESVESVESIESYFFPEHDDIHEKCKKKYKDCECQFRKLINSNSKKNKYYCYCHPNNYERCECYDQFYNP